MICRRDRPFLFTVLLAGIASLGACAAEPQAPEIVEQARHDIDAGRIADAEFALNRLLAGGAAPTSLAAYLGEAALARRDLDTAAKWLDSYDFSEATRAHGLRMRGRLAMGRGDLPAAGRAFDMALQMQPRSPDLWVDIGRLRYRGGEHLQALDAARRAVELGPGHADALQFRGQLTRDSEGLIPATDWFQRALESKPEDVDIRVDMAATLGDAGRTREALEVLRGGGGRAASSPDGLLAQAVIAARGGKDGVARSLLQRSKRDREGVPSAKLLSAILDLSSGNPASAAQELDRLHKAQPDNSRIVDLLALALAQSGSDTELVERFAPIAEGAAASNFLRILVGRSYENLDRRAEAAKFLDMAAQASDGLHVLPDRPSRGLAAERDSVRRSIRDGQAAPGIASALSLSRRHPGSADMLALLGDAQLSAAKRPQALEAYAQSAQVRRPWVLVPRMLASFVSRYEAQKLLEQVVRSSPANGDAAAMLADAYALEGKWQQSAMLLDHAMAHGQARVPWVLSARSIAAMRLGQPEEGLQYALAAHSLQPMNPAVIRALLEALPAQEIEARRELAAKLRSLSRR